MSVILIAVLLASSSRICHSYLKVRSIPCATSTSKSNIFMSNVDVERVEPQSSNLIAVARSFATTNLGVTDPSLLADDFLCSGPSFNGIDKKSYLAGLTKETAVFQRAMPDFDLRPYSFAVDESQPNTVWFKIRPKGTLTGPFAFKGEVYLPNQKVAEQPAQQLSVTIRSGQVTRVTAGYIIDRFTGNTGGLAGPFGILYALDEAPSKFDYFPPAVVVKQFFSRTKKPLKRKAVAVSPFPVAVMTSLAKRLVETSLGAEEPSLLASEFQFSGPVVGPLVKEEFVGALKNFNLKSFLPDLKTTSYCFEVDSFDPERVWVISKGSGTMTAPLVFGGKEVLPATGKAYVGAPEAVSVSFNEQGLCYRATAGYILDKEQGNTKGLGGIYGILEAIGSPIPWWESRTLSELPTLIKESLFPSSAPVESARVESAVKRPVIVAKEVTKPAEVRVAPKESPPPAPVRPVAVVAPAPKPAPVVEAPRRVEKKSEPKDTVIPAKALISAPPPKAPAPPSPKGGLFASILPNSKPVTKTGPSVRESVVVVAPPSKTPAPPSPKGGLFASILPNSKPVTKPGPSVSESVVVVAPPSKTPTPPSPKGGLFAGILPKAKVSESVAPAASKAVAEASKPIPASKAPPAPAAKAAPSKIVKKDVAPVQTESVPDPKPKSGGGMFSMTISKGGTGKLSTGPNKLKEEKSTTKK
jgi:hypothetical protein